MMVVVIERWVATTATTTPAAGWPTWPTWPTRPSRLDTQTKTNDGRLDTY